jgi:hypothetical protein
MSDHNTPAAIAQRRENNSFAYLAMEAPTRDLATLGCIAREYVWDKLELGNSLDEGYSELNTDDRLRIMHLVDQLAVQAAALHRFYTAKEAAMARKNDTDILRKL